METRNCTSCKGTGKSSWMDRVCVSCNGTGTFSGLDIPAIIEAIKGRKGLRSKAPAYCGKDFTIANVRAYYVWRMARFHGGVDVTMPIVASTMVHGDPFIKELESVADAVAKRVFGTDLAAAYRWGNLLVGSMPVPDGMPVTAYAHGPVVTAEKPEEEYPEMF